MKIKDITSKKILKIVHVCAGSEYFQFITKLVNYSAKEIGRVIHHCATQFGYYDNLLTVLDFFVKKE